MDKYDSTNDTKTHIKNVQNLLDSILDKIAQRAARHDRTKLLDPEKSMYDEFTPQLKELTYGSDEYKAVLVRMGEALKHHYKWNSHHPEHWENGIGGMSLLDLIEMVADWKAASLRHSNGSIIDSLKINKERFGISDQLYEVIKNTVEEMDW
jgi:hypothetical protein